MQSRLGVGRGPRGEGLRVPSSPVTTWQVQATVKACIHLRLPNAPWALPGSQVPLRKSFPQTLALDSVARFQDEDRTEGTWERVSVLVTQRSQARRNAPGVLREARARSGAAGLGGEEEGRGH